MVTTIDVRRIYDDDLPDEGEVFLVDRIWPRGIRRDSVHVTGWLRDVAPSDELRRMAHSGGDFEEFARRYIEQLDASPDAVQPLIDAARRGPVTLLYGSRDRQHNNAVVLRDYLIRRLK